MLLARETMLGNALQKQVNIKIIIIGTGPIILMDV